MDYCSLPGSSVGGILQARLMEWVAIFFSRASSASAALAGGFFDVEPPRKPWEVCTITLMRNRDLQG